MKVVELASGRTITSFFEPWGHIEEAAFSPDGKWILAACTDEPVTVRDACTGDVLCDAPTSCDQVQWAPDGKRFVAVSRDSRSLFQLENLSLGPIIVTAWVAPSNGSSAVGCPLCRRWSEVDIANGGPEIECLHCQASLRLNSFVIRVEWEPVAKAWRGEQHRSENKTSTPKRKESRRATY